MNLLLDTHTVIWSLTNPLEVSQNPRQLIESLENKCFVSIGSLWEMAIKSSLGKLELPHGINPFFKLIPEAGFELLPISINHVLEVHGLPFHHKDPFDRMLIAQAKSENLTVISKDPEFKKYDINVIW